MFPHYSVIALYRQLYHNFFLKNNFDLIIIKMEQKHQDIIKRNYSVLVKKMTATWVAERLFEDGIITEEMKENIINAKDWI